MQSLSSDEIMRRAVRGEICTSCRFRPPGSEALGRSFPRICEARCAIFTNLKTLAAIAVEERGDPRASFERAIVESVCLECLAAPTAGEFCAERLTRRCPLSCYAGRVLEVIEPIAVRKLGVRCGSD